MFSQIYTTMTAVGGMIALLLLLPAPASAQKDTAAEPGLLIEASIEYHYGDEDQGDLDLDPKLGMVAPDLTVWLPKRKVGFGLRYLSGDFDGKETVQLDSGGGVSGRSDFGSRKEVSPGQSREDVQIQAHYRPLEWLTFSAGYRYLEFALMNQLDFVSDARTYGQGKETYDATARGMSFGLGLDVPLKPGLSLQMGADVMPWMHTKVSGSYDYMFTIDGRSLAEQWTVNGSAQGFDGVASLEYTFPGERVALRMGYVFQQFESLEDVEATWVDEMLGNEARDWRTDTYHGATFSTVFQF